MSWLSIAAELVRGAMSSREPRPPRPQAELPSNAPGLLELVQRYRSEVERGLAAVSQAIQDQNERQLEAFRIQRRWNYGLLIGLVAVAALAVSLYLRN
jgi:hypothetical protein